MERLRRDAETGWTATSDAALLLELRALSGRILARATETSSAVDALVSEGSRCDVRVRDACTRFRQLEDTAHVEHRVLALGAEDARVRRGSSAASSSSLEEDVPESSRVESRYREALRVTIRTTRGKWLLPAPREGVVAGDVGARDDDPPSSNEPLDHADARDEGERRDGPAPGSSGEATQTLTALPPPRLVGNRFWRPLPHVIGTRQFYHDENVTADWSPALAPDEFTAKAVMRGARGASDDDAFSGDDAEGATAEARSNAKNKNHGAATFSTYAWDEASFFGDPAVFEDLSLRAGREIANDVDGTVSSAEEDDTRRVFGFDDDEDEDEDEDEDASRYTESSLSAADEDDAFGDSFAAAARRDRSRFADARDDKSETASSFSSASVMAASERTQNARGSPARRDKSDFRIGSRRGGDARRDGETTERGGRRRDSRRLGDRASSRVSERDSFPTSPRLARRPGLAPVDFVAMTEAALRDPGVAPPARRRGGLFDDDDDDDDDHLFSQQKPGAAAGAGASVTETGGDETETLPGKDGTTGGGLFDDDDDDEEEEEALFEEHANAAPATTRGLFESDDESNADDEARGRREKKRFFFREGHVD